MVFKFRYSVVFAINLHNYERACKETSLASVGCRASIAGLIEIANMSNAVVTFGRKTIRDKLSSSIWKNALGGQFTSKFMNSGFVLKNFLSEVMFDCEYRPKLYREILYILTYPAQWPHANFSFKPILCYVYIFEF